MEEIEEKQDITNKINLLMILLLTISIIAISSFIVFFIGVTRVDALQLSYDNLPQDGKPYYIGTRSGGQITERTVSYVTRDTLPPFEIGQVNLNSSNASQYWSIGLSYTTRVNRVYMVTMYYYGGTDSIQLNELTGICTGDLATCSRNQQTINYTRLYFSSGNTIIEIEHPYLRQTANGLEETTENYKAKKIQTIFISNNNGSVVSMYLNATANISNLQIISVGVEDLGLSENFFSNLNQDNKNYMDTKTQAIMDWVTGKTNDLQTQITNLTSLENNHYTWLTGQITNARSEISNAKTSIENTINSATQSTNQAINNQTQDITNNNNYNTNQQINNYNDSLQSCGTGFNDISQTLSASYRYLMNNGTLREHSNFDVSDYIGVEASTQYVMTIDAPFEESQWASMCQYDENKALISCQQYTTQREQTWTTASNTKYMRFSFIRDGSKIFMLNGYTCNTRSEEDLAAGDKRPVNNSGVEGYINSENSLKAQMNTDSLNSVDIDIDLNSNNWIWQTMTAFFNTNTVIMTMIISILSIGVIKLVLTR